MPIRLPEAAHYRVVPALDGYDVVSKTDGQRKRAGLSLQEAAREMQALEDRYAKATAPVLSKFMKEGYAADPRPGGSTTVMLCAGLWNRVNGHRDGYSWEDDPWVWVLDLEEGT